MLPNADEQAPAVTLTEAFATPSAISPDRRTVSGCLYRSDGTKVAASERAGEYLGDHVKTDNPPVSAIPGTFRRLSGRSLYLGHHMGGHYGHFITEGLSAFWALREYPAQTFEHFVMHRFIFDTAMTDYMRFCLRAFDIPEERLTFVDTTPVVFDEVVVPARLFQINKAADERMRWVYETISHSASDSGPSPSRIYLSKRKFSSTHRRRVIANEIQIEQLFAGYGFSTVFPEELSFQRQLQLYAGAEAVAGFTGSALHNSLFVKPGTVVIELGDPRFTGKPSPTQVVCDRLSGVSSVFIPFKGRVYGARQTMLTDIPSIKRALDLSPLPNAHVPAPIRHPVRDCATIAYRLVRPAAGGLMGKVVPHRFKERVRSWASPSR